MPFIPHTEADVEEMLKVLEIDTLEALFDEIPSQLKVAGLPVPVGLNEMQMGRLMKQRAGLHTAAKCFIGAGAYEHHIPAAVWDVTQRGEFLTAYTPYQAEASQGTLQLLFEYQTMMSSLMGMDVSNASLYEGATAVVEALLMACRLQKNVSSVWIPQNLHPLYRQTIKTLLSLQNIAIVEIPLSEQGTLSVAALDEFAKRNPACTAMVIAQPNFLGCLEAVDELTDWAHAQGALVIGVVNPLLMSWLKPPGQWGKMGADIACGEGQPLGVPLAHGGPYFGFICTHMKNVRQMPGRIVGQTTDKEGNIGYTLTLQAREQHIRRAKATSNICTNQGLLVTAATIYMSLMGPEGLKKTAQTCYAQTQILKQLLQHIPGVQIVFNDHFHELVIEVSTAVEPIINEMYKKGIAAGIALEPYYPNLKNCLLICVTETKSKEDLEQYAQALASLVKKPVGVQTW